MHMRVLTPCWNSMEKEFWTYGVTCGIRASTLAAHVRVCVDQHTALLLHQGVILGIYRVCGVLPQPLRRGEYNTPTH